MTEENGSALLLHALNVREADSAPCRRRKNVRTCRNKTEYGKSKHAGGGTLYEVLCVGKICHQLSSKLFENQCGKGVLTSYTIHSVNRKGQLLREKYTYSRN